MVLIRELKSQLREHRHEPHRASETRGASRQASLCPLHALTELEQTLVGLLQYHIQAIERVRVTVLESGQNALFNHPELVGCTVQTLRDVVEVSSPFEVFVDYAVEFLQREGLRVLYAEMRRLCSSCVRACVGAWVCAWVRV